MQTKSNLLLEPTHASERQASERHYHHKIFIRSECSCVCSCRGSIRRRSRTYLSSECIIVVLSSYLEGDEVEDHVCVHVRVEERRELGDIVSVCSTLRSTPPRQTRHKQLRAACGMWRCDWMGAKGQGCNGSRGYMSSAAWKRWMRSGVRSFGHTSE